MKHYENITCVTFDVGGTLLYPWPSVGEIYNRVFTKYGLTCQPDEINTSFFKVWNDAHLIPRDEGPGSEKPWWREIVHRVLMLLGGTHHEHSIFEELWSTFCHPENWKLYDGAEEVLVQLRAAGYRLAILSNWDERLRPLLVQLDLLKYFEAVIISCEVGVEKPHAGIFDCVLNKIDVDPGTILHVGDSEHHDQVGAENAGWQCLLVAPGESRGDKLSDLRLIPDMLMNRSEQG